MKTQSLQRRAFFFVAALILVYLALFSLGNLLVYSDEKQSADAIVVLGGEVEYRSQLAAKLYQREAAPVIILTQGYGERSWNRVIAMKKAITDQKVPIGAITVATGDATSTFDEAEQVLEFVKSANLNSVLIVTDPYHTLRAKLLFSQVLGSEGFKVRVASPLAHWYNPWTWMFRVQGWQVTVRESIKLAGIGFGIKGG